MEKKLDRKLRKVLFLQRRKKPYFEISGIPMFMNIFQFRLVHCHRNYVPVHLHWDYNPMGQFYLFEITIQE